MLGVYTPTLIWSGMFRFGGRSPTAETAKTPPRKPCCDGQLIAHKRERGAMEVIPVGECRKFGVSLGGQTAAAMALDVDGKPLGPAQTRREHGLVYITPVPKAFSYRLQPTDAVPASPQ